jgi:hypothetical protein
MYRFDFESSEFRKSSEPIINNEFIVQASAFGLLSSTKKLVLLPFIETGFQSRE